MTNLDSQKIKNLFKELLKKKNINYEEVAQHLGCSIPTVNRILGSEEITLTRILQLCELVNISFSDLAAMTKEDTTAEAKFTEEQEIFLSKNGNYFLYLLNLLKNQTPKQIASEFGLTQLSTDKYLIGLEKHGLIKVNGKNKVSPIFQTMPKLGQGPLGKTYFEKIITAGSRFFIDHIRNGIHKTSGASPSKVTINGSKMTKLSYSKYVEEQEKLINHYIQISDYEEKIKKPDELQTVVIMSAHTQVENEDKNLVSLDNVFGKITNI